MHFNIVNDRLLRDKHYLRVSNKTKDSSWGKKYSGLKWVGGNMGYKIIQVE